MCHYFNDQVSKFWAVVSQKVLGIVYIIIDFKNKTITKCDAIKFLFGQ